MRTPKLLHAAAFRRRMVKLVRPGRKPTQFARAFNVTTQRSATWVAQAGADSGKPARNQDLPSNAAREELARLRHENRQRKVERAILAKATAWFAVKSDETCIESSNP